eukprot:CAMPEP_0168332178 /NCGR_PEP_ID=MMETSP0213-20121227/8801_1 /TAXON_ID=151035 /ORGANISM="Euplotes harpa, Strain FSP1.4" /LENGTH=222 /DNA_ID=CAMNT_0008336149 /DNA_START=12 /DNA_END=677 /DNA_ORIENTATION=-
MKARTLKQTKLLSLNQTLIEKTRSRHFAVKEARPLRENTQPSFIVVPNFIPKRKENNRNRDLMKVVQTMSFSEPRKVEKDDCNNQEAERQTNLEPSFTLHLNSQSPPKTELIRYDKFCGLDFTQDQNVKSAFIWKDLFDYAKSKPAEITPLSEVIKEMRCKNMIRSILKKLELGSTTPLKNFEMFRKYFLGKVKDQVSVLCNGDRDMKDEYFATYEKIVNNW